MSEDLLFLAAAYAVIWLLIFGYVLTLGQRARDLRRDVDLITQVLREREAAQKQPAGEPAIRAEGKRLEVREPSAAS